MVHGFAEQSGGRLILKSRKGEGTTAEIWLPVGPVDAVSASGEPGEEMLAMRLRLTRAHRARRGR